MIENDKVVVRNDAGKKPVAVRYAYGDIPDYELFNQFGLPAVPFRTDRWERTSLPDQTTPAATALISR